MRFWFGAFDIVVIEWVRSFIRNFISSWHRLDEGGQMEPTLAGSMRDQYLGRRSLNVLFLEGRLAIVLRECGFEVIFG